MKKTKKLAIRKVTLRNVDESKLDGVVGGNTGDTCAGTCYLTCPKTCSVLPPGKPGPERAGFC
ncbi:MAG: hypothetical protein WAN65_06665 [Candidatus Sulfotelmatobacter sp.]